MESDQRTISMKEVKPFISSYKSIMTSSLERGPYSAYAAQAWSSDSMVSEV
jgi:hypothetical protein